MLPKPLNEKFGAKKSRKEERGLKVKLSPKETATKPLKVEKKVKRRKK